MRLVFEGGGEVVGLNIERKSKRVKIVTSKTGYKLREIPWKQLFDEGKEAIQEAETDKMDDDEFIKEIIKHMNKAGYILRSLEK